MNLKKHFFYLVVLFGYFFTSLNAKKETEHKEQLLAVLEEYCGVPNIDIILFAPDNGRLYKMLIRGLIQTTSSDGSIQVAAFRFTDKEVKSDLIDAHNRGVKVEIVFDPGAMTSTFYSLAFSLCESGIAVYQYIPVGLIPLSQRINELQRISYQAIMHHKTMLFKKTFGGKDIVVFGSLNFTTAGFYGNEELVQVRNKSEIVAAISEHFEKLKTRSYKVETYRLIKPEILRNVQKIFARGISYPALLIKKAQKISGLF